MENRYIVFEMGRLLVERIADILKQEFDIQKEQVGLGIPGEDSQLLLCVYPYDIRKNMDIPAGQPVAVGSERLRNPSSFYDIYYMLVPCSNGDLKYRMEEELKLMDVLLRRLGDITCLEEETQALFTLCSPDFDEKVKIWNALNHPLRIALYCMAGPVELQSGRVREIKRVKEIDMQYMEKGEK